MAVAAAGTVQHTPDVTKVSQQVVRPGHVVHVAGMSTQRADRLSTGFFFHTPLAS